MNDSMALSASDFGDAPTKPARLGRGDATLVLVAAGAFVAFPFAGAALPLFAVLFALVAAAGFARRARPVAALGTFGAIFVLAQSVPFFFGYWPLQIAVAALAFAGLCRVSPLLADGLSFMRRGRVDRMTLVGIFATTAIAATALV